MSNYLWDRSGPPDPEIERLEAILKPLRWSGAPAVRTRRVNWGAIAASVVLGVAVWQLMRPAPERQMTAWTESNSGRRVYAGEWMRAASGSPLVLESDAVGRVEVQSGSEIRVIESAPGRERMQLEQGTMRALIWAPPRQFAVDTPSARAVDLGCEYELSVDPRGDGFIRVLTGWVAFQAGKQESFIPAGAACRTNRARGPGVPYFESASREFRAALASWEGGRPGVVMDVVKAAGKDDGLSLWHLLARANRVERGVVFDRLAQLVPLPAGVSRANAVAGDRATLDACWNALGFEDAEWWREWKRDWR